MDISETLAPTSDQLDAVDLLSGARIFTVEKVSKGNPEQPVNVHLQEFPRPWRPGKSMRRVLAACWGPDASAWVGRRVELYCEPSVRFGGSEVGGTRIRALSHIDSARKVPLLVSRGKSAIYVVEPLANAPTPQQPTDRTAAAITAFAALGITEDMLTEHIGTPRAQWDVTALLDLYKRVKAGELTAADFAPAVTVNTETGEIADEPGDFDVQEQQS